MSRIVSAIVLLAIAAATVLYSVFAHHLTASGDRSELAYVFALGSLYAVALCVAFGSPYRRAIILVASAAVLLGWWYRDANVWDPTWIYLFQHVGANVGLGLLFGLTLRSPRGSLITRLATIVHGELPPAAVRYTRQVTLAWTLFFATMATTSVLLFALAPADWWSIFVNFMSMPLVVLMFVLEYAVRRCVVSDLTHKGILESVRAYSRMRRGDSPR